MAVASKAGVIAGRAFVIIEALDATAPVLRSVERGLLSLGSRLQRLSTQLFTRALTAAIPGAISTRLFQQYDDIMRRVEARSGGTAKEMQDLRDQTRQLGMTTAFSARQIAALQDVLGQRKYNRKQIFEMTEPILMLARAAGEGNMDKDILDSADLVSQALLMFQADTKDTGDIADTFTQAANESNFALEDLQISLAASGPVVKQFNLSLQETIAMLMVMRDLGIDPSTAGTGLRNLVLKASEQKNVDNFNEQLKALTGSIINFNDANDNLQRPDKILDAFNTLTKGLGTAARANLLRELVGLRAIVPTAALAGNARSFEQAMQALADRAGTTKKAYDLMEGGIGGAFRRLVNNAEELGLKIGDTLAPTLDVYGKMLRTGVQNIGKWIAAHRDAVRMINLFVIALFPTAAALFLTGTALRLVTFTLHPFIVLWSTVLGLFSLSSAVLVTLATAGFGVLRQAMLATWIILRSGVASITPVTGSLRVLLGSLLILRNAVLLNIALFRAFIPAMLMSSIIIRRALNSGFQAFEAIILRLAPSVLWFGNALVATGRVSVRTADLILSSFLRIIAGLGFAASFLLSLVEDIPLIIERVIFSLGSTMLSVISGLVSSVVAVIPTLLAGLVLWSVGMAVISALASTILATLTTIYTQIIAIGTAVYTGIAGSLSAASDKLLAFAQFAFQIGNSISKALMAGDTELALNIAIAAMKVAWIDFAHFIKSIWKTVVDYIRSTFEELKRSFLLFIYEHGDMINYLNRVMHPNQIFVKDLVDMQSLASELFVNKLGNPAANDRQRQEAAAAEKHHLADRQAAMDDLLDLLEVAKGIPDPMEQLRAMENAIATHPILPAAMEDLIGAGGPAEFSGFGGTRHIEGVQQRTKEGAIAAYENSEASKDSLNIQQQLVIEAKKQNEKLEELHRTIKDQTAKAPASVNGV